MRENSKYLTLVRRYRAWHWDFVTAMHRRSNLKYLMQRFHKKNWMKKKRAKIQNNLLWSGGTGHDIGTLSRQCKWQAKPHISHTTPWRVKPTIREVQWLHFRGELNVRIKNWCVLLALVGTTPAVPKKLLWGCCCCCWRVCWFNDWIVGGCGGGWLGGWIGGCIRPPTAGDILSCCKIKRDNTCIKLLPLYIFSNLRCLS